MESSLPAEAFAHFGDRIKGFAHGAGTVIVFEDQEAIEDLKKRQPVSDPERSLKRCCVPRSVPPRNDCFLLLPRHSGMSLLTISRWLRP